MSRRRGWDPTTDTELFDFLHRMFGWGTYDEYANRDVPWWQYRRDEIGKLRGMRTRRGVSVAQLVETARWCRQNNVNVRSHAGLFYFVADALADRGNAFSPDPTAAALLDDAIRVERDVGDPDGWAARMDRATDKAGVYEEWLQARGRASTASTST